MKTRPLRELVRHPGKVKRLTAGGQAVRITDNGRPLWVVTADTVSNEMDSKAEAARILCMEEELDRMLHEPKSKVSAAQFILDSRQC
jgi:hypothetical protein